MDYKQRKIQAFREKFKHSQFVNYAEIEAFLAETIEECRQNSRVELAEELLSIDGIARRIMLDSIVEAKFGKEEG